MSRYIGTLIQQFKLKEKEIEEVESALKKLRGGDDWESGIAKDERKPIITLFEELKVLRHELNVMANTEVKLIDVPEIPDVWE
jgi:hypothetical protein